jgi:hypothetical protein
MCSGPRRFPRIVLLFKAAPSGRADQRENQIDHATKEYEKEHNDSAASCGWARGLSLTGMFCGLETAGGDGPPGSDRPVRPACRFCRPLPLLRSHAHRSLARRGGLRIACDKSQPATSDHPAIRLRISDAPSLGSNRRLAPVRSALRRMRSVATIRRSADCSLSQRRSDAAGG